MEAYRAYRIREHKKGALSQTRTRVELLFETIAPVPCLETNLYEGQSPRLAELAKDKQTPTPVLEFLLRTVKPAVVLAHGEPVVRHFETLAERSLALDQFHEVEIYGRAIVIYPRHHLSYQLSHDDCRKLGALMKARALDADRPMVRV